LHSIGILPLQDFTILRQDSGVAWRHRSGCSEAQNFKQQGIAKHEKLELSYRKLK